MRKILIVVDMQNDFVTGSLGTPEAQAIVPKVVDKVKECNDNGYDIFFTQDTHEEDYYCNTLEGKYLPVEHCLLNTYGYKIIDQLSFADNKSTCIDKYTFGYDDWHNEIERLLIRKEYDDDLKNWNTSGAYLDYSGHCLDRDLQFELIGLCTDICVVSNALILRAQFPDSEIIVHADCCAGTTPEKHAAALEVMKSCQIQIKGE